jgi:hypothetical protein
MRAPAGTSEPDPGRSSTVEPNVSTPPERRHTIAETLALVDHIRRIACDRSLDDRDIARHIRDALREHAGEDFGDGA